MKNVELEKAVLSMLIIDQYIPKNLELTEEDFFDYNNRLCFKAIIKHNASFELVLNELSKITLFNYNDYFADLMEKKPIFDIKKAELELKKYTVKRQAIHKCEEYKSGKIELINLISDLNRINKTKITFNPKSADTLESNNIKFNLHFPQGEVSLIAGMGGAGKTYMAIYLAMKFCNLYPAKKCLLWLTEDAEAIFTERLNYISRNYQMPIPQNLFVEFNNPAPIMEKQYGQIKKTKEYNELMEYILNYDLIFLDPLGNFNPFGANDNKENRYFINSFREKITKSNKSIVFLHHTNKIQIAPLGSLCQVLTHEQVYGRVYKVEGANQITATARFVCYFETAGDSHYKKLLSVIKSNVGRTGDVIDTLETPHKTEG